MIVTAEDYLKQDRAALKTITKMLRGGSDPTEIMQKISDWLSVRLELFRAIQALPDRQDRLVLMEYYLNGQTIQRIAEESGVGQDAVFRQKRLALKNLGTMLKERSNNE